MLCSSIWGIFHSWDYYGCFILKLGLVLSEKCVDTSVITFAFLTYIPGKATQGTTEYVF